MLILDGHTTPVSALAFSPDSVLLASGAKDGSVRFWEPAGGGTGTGPTSSACNGVAFHPDGRLVVGGDDVGYVRSSDAVYRPERVIGLVSGTVVTGVAVLDPNAVAIGTGSRSRPTPGFLGLLNERFNDLRKPVFAEPHGVRAVAAHPPTRAFAWTNGSRRATVRTLDRQDPIHFNLTHNAPAVAFHPDGTLIAVAQEWGAKVFDLTRRQERTAIKGHKGQVSSLAFSPDGRYLATGSWDGTVRLWDPLTGAERQSYQWPTGKVYAVAYAPDGTRLAAAGSSGTVVVWDTE